MSFLPAEAGGASQNGVHVHSMPISPWPWFGSDPSAPLDWSQAEKWFNYFSAIDPQAVFIVRVRSEPPRDWVGWAAAPPADIIKYQDGSIETSNLRLSLASQYAHDNSIANVRNFVRHFESSPLGKRIIGYHITGEDTGEWFGFAQDYRVKGPEYSGANIQGFRNWLRQEYGTDSRLALSWGQTITFDNASIPVSSPDRFPVHGGYNPVQAFYNRPSQQDWIDFSAYESDLTSQWILDLAQVVKQETQGKKLTAFFYGYVYDAAGSFGGHLRVDRLLSSPDIDIIAGPISYINNQDRWYGGPAGFMSAVDSVASHGKLWINENDILAFHVPDTSFAFASNTLQRDLGSVLVHRAGTWWMDLFETGPFSDARLWKTMGNDGVRNYQNIYSAPTAYTPEVAVITDSISQEYVNSDWDVFANSLPLLRNAAERSGASIGYYTVDDFVAGVGPRCRVYLFANTYSLSDSEVTAINRRLDSEGATAIWQYAPGFIGTTVSGADRTSALTGIVVVQADGYTGSDGLGGLQGKSWGLRQNSVVSPRLIVQDPTTTSLGQFYVDKTISAAVKRVGSHTSIFVGDFILSSAVLRELFQEAGAHIWTTDDSIVHTDGSLLVVHSPTSGMKKIAVPTGVSVQQLDGQLTNQDSNSISTTFAVGETHWFKSSIRSSVHTP